MQVTDRPSPDAPSLTKAIIVLMETDVCAECAFYLCQNSKGQCVKATIRSRTKVSIFQAPP